MFRLLRQNSSFDNIQIDVLSPNEESCGLKQFLVLNVSKTEEVEFNSKRPQRLNAAKKQKMEIIKNISIQLL